MNLTRLIGGYNGVSYMSVTSSSIFILQKKEDEKNSILQDHHQFILDSCSWIYCKLRFGNVLG